MRPLLLAGLAACAPGPNEETLVAELRVMLIVPDAAEYAPGDVYVTNTIVFDPSGEGADLLVWSCTPTGEATCLEDEVSVADRARVVRGVDTETATDGQLSAALAALLPAGVAVPTTSVWALACAPGLCPIIDDADAGAVDTADLADPTRFMGTLPMVGVSLGRTSVWVSDRPAEERHQHPVVTRVDDGPLLGTDQEPLALTFAVTEDGQADAPTAYGYATGGGFGSVSEDVIDGAVSLDWYAPAEVGKQALLVVVRDALGGVAYWRDAATSQPSPTAARTR